MTEFHDQIGRARDLIADINDNMPPDLNMERTTSAAHRVTVALDAVVELIVELDRRVTAAATTAEAADRTAAMLRPIGPPPGELPRIGPEGGRIAGW